MNTRLKSQNNSYWNNRQNMINAVNKYKTKRNKMEK